MTKDMTVGTPGKTLFLFAVPMVLGNLFQQLYNIVDSIIVGNYVGADALAAVGASASITFLFIAVASGMSIGSSVVISQLFGAKKYARMKSAIYTILIAAFAVSALLTIIGVMGIHTILNFMSTPEKIFEDASVYLRIYFFGLIFLFLYNMLTAVFNSLGNSKTPLVFLMFSSFLNIGLDILFVVRFKMGVAGVAYATLIAQGTSAVLSFVLLMIRLHRMKAEEEFSYFDFSILGTMCKIAVPSMIQQSMVSIGIVLVQRLVNGYDTSVIAGYTAATKIDNIAIFPMVSVGSAMSTFTAQNIGAGKSERIKEGLKAALGMCAVIGLGVTAVLFLWGNIFIGAFVDTAGNPRVIEVGVEYLRVVGVFYILMGSMNSCNGILRGSGDIKVFMICTLCNLGTRVILAYVLSPFLGAGAIWWAIPIGWLVGLMIAAFRYRSGKWKGKSLVK